jgi:gamma-glutamyltranspeptidase/glutathione hydrolase
LAEVLKALGISGPAAFYNGGNLTLEMVAEVSARVGGKVMPSGLCYKDALLLLPSFLSTYSL